MEDRSRYHHRRHSTRAPRRWIHPLGKPFRQGFIVRNVFDQYSQPENRVTHALMTALHEDRRLLDSFLRDLIKVKPPVSPEHLKVLEQQFPGEEAPSDEADLERRGIPDAWIVDQEGWCVLI